MKLPEDKKERVKLLIFLALAAVGLLYGLGVGVVSPMLKGRKDKAEEISNLDVKILKAGKAVSVARAHRDANAAILNEVMEAANRRNFVLHDRLGNYLLGAQEILDIHARKAGVTLDAVTEVGQSQIPGTSISTNGPSFRSYTVHVTLRAGTHDLIKFLEELEAGNPYLCVSAISINGQPAKPDTHDIALDVQWPIWSSAEASAQIEAQLKELAEDSLGAPTPQAAPPKTEKSPR